ncbi:beta-galactosidase [Fibrella sp. ES10-3-2-2]|nr:hypothetical protein A6C57_01045 [Fibrella sp. ES10-3-2-2]
MASTTDILYEVEHPTTGQRLFIRLNTSSCAAANSTYAGLSEADKRAGLSATKPALPSNEYWKVDATCDLSSVTPPPPTIQAQSASELAYSFEAANTTLRGYAFYDAINNATPPALTAGSVYWVARASMGETASQALARVRAGNVTKYPTSTVSGVRRSAISSLTPSTYRPAWLNGVYYRGDGWFCRWGVDNVGGASAIEWTLCNLDGSLLVNAGPASLPEYKATDPNFVLTPPCQSSVEVAGNQSLGAPIVIGGQYLLGLKVNGEYYVYKHTVEANPSEGAGVRQLALPGLAPVPGGGGGGGSDGGFVNHPLVDERRFGLFSYNSDRDPDTGGVPWYEREMVLYSKQEAFMNSWISTIAWDKAQNPDGSYDWRMLDTTLQFSADNEIHVKLYFDMAIGIGGGSNPDAYLLPSECMHDHAGRLIEKNDQRCASYSSLTARAKHATFLTAMLNHVKNSGHAEWVLGVMVCNGMQSEHEYPGENRVTYSPGNSNNSVQVQYDFSEGEKAAFRTRAQGWYGTVTAANLAWGTAFTTWDSVQPPVIPRSNETSSDWNYNANQHTIDWYNHRQYALADYANAWHAVVKAVSNNLKTMIKVGNLVDGLSLSRGTISVAGLLLHDCISQDNVPSYNFKLSHAVGLRSRESRFYVADEIFYVEANRYSKETQIQWIRDAYDAGCSFIDWGSYYISGGGEFDSNKRAQAKAWLKDVMTAVNSTHPIGGTVPRPAFTDTVTISNKILLYLTWQNGGGGQSAEQQVMTLINQGKTVRVLINYNLTGV